MIPTPLTRAAFAAALLASSAPLVAQNQAVPLNVPAPVGVEAEEEAEAPATTTRETATPVEEPAATPAPAPAPQPVETVEAPEIINPYANSYNDLLPIEEEEVATDAQGFNYWNLLGLLGLLGLFGLRRRDRIVYAERIDPVGRRD